LLIVTAEASGGRAGCLLCFATKGNLDPPRFLLCLPRRNRTFRVAAWAETLVAHILGPKHRQLASLFGEQIGDEGQVRPLSLAAGTGRTAMGGCEHWFAGRILDRLHTGDHVAVLVEPVVAAAGWIGAQLGFHERPEPSA